MHANDPDPHSLRRHLQALPDPLPPASLGARLQASQARRSQWLRGGAAAVVVALVAVMMLPRAADMLTSADVPAVASVPDTTRLKLRAIDQALQNAYARGASDAEVAPLWKAREQLMTAVSSLDGKPS